MRQDPRRRESFDVPDRELQSLYAQATREHWRVEELDWTALALSRIAAPTRVPLTDLYADIAFTEALCVRALQQVTERADLGPLRSFALTQLADEQQHLQFFSLVAEQIGAPEHVSPHLMQLSDELRRLSEPDELLLLLHVVELAVQKVFLASSERALAASAGAVHPADREHGARESVMALLRCVVERVGRDEARHIAFGSKYLRYRLEQRDRAERHALARHASSTAALLYRSFELQSDAFRGLVLHPHALLQQAFGLVQEELASLGIELEVPPASRR